MRILMTAIVLTLTAQLWAVNTKQTVGQVTTAVELTNDVDYIVTSATPFTDEGSINIINTEHAVVILQSVKPSAASKWLKYVKIDGEQAKNNTNCQVKIYNRGCIILPYGNNTKPLTTFTEPNFQGESCNNYGLGNDGGYMNTLNTTLLNNRIRSFKLKRGYMVTFSTQGSGRGYSRCFIAANSDLEISELPAVLDQKISSYRVFKCYDAGKKQLANCMDKTVLNALNVQSSYDWAQGNSTFLPDYEWVPNHIYEDWPSSATIGGTSQSPHCKNNNEPKNTADDHPQDLTTILNNWENMMRTGLRLCSPASWDGSDYWNATGFLADFLDSIDARGWRCDIIDLHCYWVESNFGNIANWANKYKRPIWISEWCWGASWNNNGAFASGVTQAQVKTALQSICSKLNNMNYVERYYYWNGEKDISKLYKNGLTPAGEYYASMNAPMAYNGKYDFVPTTPRQYGPSKFTVKVNAEKTRITWRDSNGEYNQLMEIQMKDETGRWVVLDTIQQKEVASSYTYDVDRTDENIQYRLHLIDLNGKEYYTSEELNVGDVVEFNEQLLYAGGNMLPNGDFNLGFTDWTSGTGKELAEPNFQVVGDGGYKGGAYLQSHLNGSMNSASAVKKTVELTPNQNYIFRVATINSGNNVKMGLSANGTVLDKEVAKATNGTEWNLEHFMFNSETYDKGILSFNTLGAKAQIDAVELRPLFASRDEAMAHGDMAAQQRAQAEEAYEEQSTALADETARIATTLAAIESKPCPGYDHMKELLAQAQDEQASKQEKKAAVSELQQLLNTNLAFVRSTKQPKYPTFANGKSDGWETVVGTYKDGDQKATTKFGKTCWNAWWSTTSKTATMEIRQTVSDLPEGYYELECKATTEHFCISDQHGYLKSGNAEAVTPVLSRDWFDLPVSDVWETLTTTPVYVPANGSVTLGFKSSKNGAHTSWWHPFGNASGSKDNREGWWCATSFVLRYHAIDDLTGISTPEAESDRLDGIYGIDGRLRSETGQLPSGLYIKVVNGQARKIILK